MNIGDTLPPFRIPAVDPEAMKTWAVALHDPNAIHLDRAAVAAKGLGDRLINQGPANLAYVINMLRAAFPGGAIRSLDVRYVDNVFEGDDVWYYVSQTMEKYTFNPAAVSQRTVVEITFNDANQVASVRTLGLEDGQQVAMNRRETPTRGRELTVLEQLLGNVGRGQLPRTDENTPGQRRPD
jgi:acyl dehydratase